MLTNLFKVETLDTRFASKTNQPLPYAQPSKWRTPEYFLYYVVFLTIPALMFKSVYDVSQPSHPTYPKYEPLLDPGWIPGRKVDNSDAQYSSFRDNVPYMAALVILHPLLRRAYESVFASNTKNSGNTAVKDRNQTSAIATPDAHLEARVRFDLAFAGIYLLALNGISSLKVFFILWLNYKIPTVLPKQSAGIATWIFNISILFANELCQGYQFKDLAAFLAPGGSKENWGATLDGYGGLMPRWEILFNITVLRLIAFNFDYIWMQDRRAASPVEVSLSPSLQSRSWSHIDNLKKKNLDPANLPERERVNNGARPDDFTFRNYLAYVLYAPLYLTGPIINFNDYISQSRYRLPSISRERIVPFAVRFVLCFMTMELCQHYLYAVAISKSNPDWSLYTPFQLSMLGYFNLHIIWLKLLLPWRLFRLWSLIDGIDPPENMVRCMSDNYSALAFWRGWHRSFNRWIVRYIYIPMGGSQGGSKIRAALNFLSVFTFVALWHDINLRLLMWGWLIVLFVLPEVIGRLLFPAKKWKDQPDVYRWICGAGAVGNILMMMAANLVGFAVGLDGLKGLVEGIIGTFGGRLFFVAACATLFVGAQVMFEVRESEKRRGIDLKC